MHRWRRATRSLPAEPEQLLGRHVGEWAYLDATERAALVAATAELLAAWKWEAASGFALTDEMCTVIAAQGALIGLGTGLEVLEEIGTVLVHPSTMVSSLTRPGPVAGLLTDEPVYLHGEAHYRGPMLLAWDAVRSDTRRFGHGFNVVIHELAHKLDMLDGMIDGTPPLPAEERERWIEVCTGEYERLRAGDNDPLLRDYAATDTGEFFAVAAEVFFDRSVELATAKPDLYDVLRSFFGSDPAERRRLHRAGPT